MADTKISALPLAIVPLAGTEQVPIVQSDETRRVTVDNLLAVLAARPLALTPPTLTGSQATSALEITQTWNTTGSPSALRITLTDTASDLNSYFVRFSVGSNHRFLVNKGGRIYFGDHFANCGMIYPTGFDANSSLIGFSKHGNWPGFVAGNDNGIVGAVARGDGMIGWASNNTPGDGALGSSDLRLWRVAADILGQHRGTNPQTSRVFGTRTDGSNGRWVELGMSSAGVAFLRPAGNGTGATGNLIHISGIPQTNPGPGILWNDGGTVKVGT